MGRPFRAIKIEGRHCFFNILAQTLPVIGLREDSLRKALSCKPSILILSDFKNNFIHGA